MQTVHRASTVCPPCVDHVVPALTKGYFEKACPHNANLNRGSYLQSNLRSAGQIIGSENIKMFFF